MRMCQALIAFQKSDRHTYIHTAAYPWPTVRNPMPCTNVLSNNELSVKLLVCVQ